MNKCGGKCIHYGLYEMVTGKQPYGYSADIPCLRCENYLTTKNEFVPKPKRDPNICDHCGGEIKIRNPKGYCDHLYYPEYCEVCKAAHKPKRELPEKIDELGIAWIATLKDKINEILDYLEEEK